MLWRMSSLKTQFERLAVAPHPHRSPFLSASARPGSLFAGLTAVLSPQGSSEVGVDEFVHHISNASSDCGEPRAFYDADELDEMRIGERQELRQQV